MLTIMVVTAAVGMAELSEGDDGRLAMLPSEVRTALELNAKVFSNLLICGTRSRQLLAPPEVVREKFGTRESETEFTQTVTFELRFRDEKFRESLRHPPGGKITVGEV